MVFPGFWVDENRTVQSYVRMSESTVLHTLAIFLRIAHLTFRLARHAMISVGPIHLVELLRRPLSCSRPALSKPAAHAFSMSFCRWLTEGISWLALSEPNRWMEYRGSWRRDESSIWKFLYPQANLDQAMLLSCDRSRVDIDDDPRDYPLANAPSLESVLRKRKRAQLER